MRSLEVCGTNDLIPKDDFAQCSAECWESPLIFGWSVTSFKVQYMTFLLIWMGLELLRKVETLMT